MIKRIFICGLTASGKSTHCKRFAKELGWRYVSSSSILLSCLGYDPQQIDRSFWFSPVGRSIQLARQEDPRIDKNVDRLLIEEAKNEYTVFDTWALPWMTECEGLTIYLRSDIQSRVRKASRAKGGSLGSLELELDKLKTSILEKDQFAKDYFLSDYQIDITKPGDNFWYDIDISSVDFENERSVEFVHECLMLLMTQDRPNHRHVFSCPEDITSRFS